MRRRSLLHRLGSSAVLGSVAGCTDSSGGDSPASPVDEETGKPPGRNGDESPGKRTDDGTPEERTDDDSTGTGTSDDGSPSSHSCDGSFYDTHLHGDEFEVTAPVVERMDTHDVGCAIRFSYMNPDDPAGSFDDLREALAPHPGRFVPFFHVDPDSPMDVQRSRLERVLEYTDVFVGVGEVAFYRPPFVGTSLVDPPWPGVFELVAERDLFVMIHPTAAQIDGLATVLGRYPEARFLIHGRGFRERLIELLAVHDNLFYTIDTAALLTAGDPPQSLLYPHPAGSGGDDDSADTFVATYDANRDRLLDRAVEEWTAVVEAAPERVTWGTDVAFEWHTDPRVYERLVSFSSAFVERLPADHRDRYAVENARRIFGDGVVLDEPDDHPPDDHEPADEP